MKCVLCKICEAANAVLDKKMSAWSETQTNEMAIWERETDPERIQYAYNIRRTDPAESFREYLALAEQGSVWSMATLGGLFKSGTGTPLDLVQAEKWYRLAYEGGSDHGLLSLGHLYVTLRQYDQAEQVFRTGVERGLVPAMFRLAWTYSKTTYWPQKREEALRLLEQASAAGDLFAKRFLGNAMVHGWFGLRRIPGGFRLLSSLADDLAALLKDEEPVAPNTDANARPGFLSHFARVFWLSAVRVPAS